MARHGTMISLSLLLALLHMSTSSIDGEVKAVASAGRPLLHRGTRATDEDVVRGEGSPGSPDAGALAQELAKRDTWHEHCEPVGSGCWIDGECCSYRCHRIHICMP
mmetsp:Transcript_127516/g.322125  ORF Transcript_127516/g.322125 Transcript_127516/m.322125 type:complete len:106 (-) Transcript_127516:8-325(-)